MGFYLIVCVCVYMGVGMDEMDGLAIIHRHTKTLTIPTSETQAAGSGGGGGGRHVRFPGTMPVNLCRKDVAALQGQVRMCGVMGVDGEGGVGIYQ